MCETTVVNKHTIQPDPARDVYIGRGSDWGNPFKLDPTRGDGTRPAVIEAYRRYLWGRPDLLSRLDELRGKRLVCFCAPQACHGDVLVRAIRWQEAEQAKQPTLNIPSA